MTASLDYRRPAVDGVREPTEVGPAVGSAAEKILRAFARFLGVGYGFFFVLMIPMIVEGTQRLESWWTPFAVLTIFGSGIALFVVSFVPNLAWIRRVATVNAIGFVVMTALWWAAWTGTTAPGDHGTWIAGIPGLTSMAAVAAWRPIAAFVQMVVVVIIVQCVNHTVRETDFGYLFIPDTVAAMTFCSVFVAAAAMAIRTGRTLDATVTATQAAAASAAAVDARSVERERFDALVHDTVMSTLLSAARQGSGERLARHATQTLARLDDLRMHVPEADLLGADGALALVRSAVSEADENIRVIPVVAAEFDGVLLSDAVRVVAAASSEAVRNSVRHAGDRAARSVRVEIGARRLRVSIEDDGVGFVPAAVSSHRLGIAVSIRGRMSQLEGGSASVRSSPGQGTTITLHWDGDE